MSAALEHPGIGRAQRAALAAAGSGLLVCALGVVASPAEFLHAWLFAWWFWLGVAIGCAQVLMLYQLVGGAWGFVIQRILEAATRTLPYMFVLAAPLVIGMTSMYSYADPRQVAINGALQHKAPYLNVPFVRVRLGIYFLVFWVVTRLLNKWSQRQDETGDYRYLRLRAMLSGPGIIACSLAVTFAVVDWFMALEPSWYSTMFPGFYLVGQVLTALAFSIIALRHLSHRGPLGEIVSPGMFHDQGNLLLTFVVLWAYVQLAQLIITWSGNLPKEVMWYLHRTRGNWAWIAVGLAGFHFFFPFFALLSRRAKLQSRRLAFLAALVLVVHLIDNYWNVEPAYHREIYVHWMDIAAPVGIGGAFVWLFLWQIGRRPLTPVHDPRLEEALEKV